jgi:hypothetical protein
VPSRLQVVVVTVPLVVQAKLASVAVVEASGWEPIDTLGAGGTTVTPAIADALLLLPTASVPTAEHSNGPSGVIEVTPREPSHCCELLADIETLLEAQVTASLLNGSLAVTLTVTDSPGYALVGTLSLEVRVPVSVGGVVSRVMVPVAEPVLPDAVTQTRTVLAPSAGRAATTTFVVVLAGGLL